VRTAALRRFLAVSLIAFLEPGTNNLCMGQYSPERVVSCLAPEHATKAECPKGNDGHGHWPAFHPAALVRFRLLKQEENRRRLQGEAPSLHALCMLAGGAHRPTDRLTHLQIAGARWRCCPGCGSDAAPFLFGILLLGLLAMAPRDGRQQSKRNPQPRGPTALDMMLTHRAPTLRRLRPT